MAAARKMGRKRAAAAEYMEEDQPFRKNAFKIIDEMVNLNIPPSEDKSLLVDEVLYSIFFLGTIKEHKCLPTHIVTDEEMLMNLELCYPKPFECNAPERRARCLPKRSPFSCVLDMIVLLNGQEDENKIIEMLKNFIPQPGKNEARDLVSSTICVSQPDKSQTSDKYYGVSMSTSGRNPGRIIVAASCLSGNWHSYVAGAVMTYNWTKKRRGSCDGTNEITNMKKERRGSYDGTIKIPKSVRCEAFGLSDSKYKIPCISCGNMFGLETDGKDKWAYGNCAEVESLSNLLKKEAAVREQARPTPASYTDANRKAAEESVLRELKDCLRMLHFNWDGQFYVPREVHFRGM